MMSLLNFCKHKYKKKYSVVDKKNILYGSFFEILRSINKD